MMQEQVPAAEEHGVDIGELLLHHTADGYELDFEPLFTFHWDPHLLEFHIGAMTLNMTPTKHVVFMVIAAVLVFLTMFLAGRALERQRAGQNAPKGLANMIEALALWVRQDVAIDNIGQHDGPRFAPYIMSIFFFILYCNLLGLMPWGASPTGNLAVTAALAILSMIIIEIGGMLKLGFRGYMRTIFPAIPGVSGGAAVLLSTALGPIEFLGKLVKPFALAVRLFGNMTAGHFVILALFGMIFLFGSFGVFSWAIAFGSAALVLAIMLLELIVAFVQAYVFTLITAVLIGVMQHEH